VETGQEGHTGLYGSDETQRVSWTGYGGGATIHCDEAWAASTDVTGAVYNAWSDATHQEVMLNGWGNRYTDAGGGVADWGNGLYVFVFDVCLVEGKGSSGSVPSSSGSGISATTQAAATHDYSNYVYSVVTATPQSDGSVKHVVQNGQTLTSIADAYGITVEDLRKRNNMTKDESTIWTGQELVIYPAGSVTAAPQEATATPAAGEAVTPAAQGEFAAASPNAQAYVPPPTETPQLAQQPTQVKQQTKSEDQKRLQVYGILLILVSGVGLISILIFSNRR
jgi:LysM repeat protein